MTAAFLMALAKQLHVFASFLRHGVTPNLVIVVGTVIRRDGEKITVSQELAGRATTLLRNTLDQFIRAELEDLPVPAGDYLGRDEEEP